jgi:hypothetical protein
MEDFYKDISGTKYTIKVNPVTHYGYFENNKNANGGGLWFEGLELTDYDGVFELPAEVITQLRANGYTVNAEFE